MAILKEKKIFFFRNIFFDKKILKLGDIGLSELVDNKLTEKLFKTYGSCFLYTSPEMFDMEYNEKTDIW